MFLETNFLHVTWLPPFFPYFHGSCHLLQEQRLPVKFEAGDFGIDFLSLAEIDMKVECNFSHFDN